MGGQAVLGFRHMVVVRVATLPGGSRRMLLLRNAEHGAGLSFAQHMIEHILLSHSSCHAVNSVAITSALIGVLVSTHHRVKKVKGMERQTFLKAGVIMLKNV